MKVALNEDAAKCPALTGRVALRTMDADAFIDRHASGTLRKNKRLGMAWRAQYLAERTAYEFGWGFECLPRSRVTFGDAYTEGDEKALTEAGWLCERHLVLCTFPEDRYEVKYLNVDYGDDRKKEGVGLILRETSAPFVPDGHIVFAVVAEFDPALKKWRAARNPS